MYYCGMDGTVVNFNAIKLFVCKLGYSLEEIDGAFIHDAYDYKIYFTPDPPHMLKLTRNALGDLYLFLDNKGRKIEWKFITVLHEEQTKHGLKFGNNLSGRHM